MPPPESIRRALPKRKAYPPRLSPRRAPNFILRTRRQRPQRRHCNRQPLDPTPPCHPPPADNPKTTRRIPARQKKLLRPRLPAPRPSRLAAAHRNQNRRRHARHSGTIRQTPIHRLPSRLRHRVRCRKSKCTWSRHCQSIFKKPPKRPLFPHMNRRHVIPNIDWNAWMCGRLLGNPGKKIVFAHEWDYRTSRPTGGKSSSFGKLT